MLKKSLAFTLSLLFLTFAFSISADAQIEKVTFYLDAFLCNNVCVNTIKSVLKFYEKAVEDIAVSQSPCFQGALTGQRF